MEKINIAELLKGCPQGMELDCTMYDNVTLDSVSTESHYPIKIVTKNGFDTRLTKYGQNLGIEDAKCVIFPKGKTTWEGFVPPCKFKDGDVVTNIEGAVIIYKEISTSGYCGSFVSLGKYNQLIPHYESYLTGSIRLSTEEEKEKLFKAIKDNGYKWNAETKTLEELIEPKFKVGDKITDKNKFIYRITEITDKGYKLHDLRTTFITFEEADLYFVKVVDVFDITTLKPFDKILVRDNDDTMWIAALFSHLSHLREMRFYTVSTWYKQCIPFEGNQHLLGTTNDCDEIYKTWTNEEN